MCNISALIFNFVLEYTPKRVQENEEGMKVNRKHPLLMYSTGNLLGKNKYYMKYILLLETTMDDF
jgi:hypothetical protein